MQVTLTRQEFTILSITVLVAICGTLGIDIHLASMPHIMAYLQTDKQHMQQSVSIFLLGMGSSLLFYGPLSDRYGRKPIVIFGLLLAILSSYATPFTTTIHTFLLTRLLQGIGSGVCLGLGRTIVADVLQGDRLATVGSYFAMVFSLSPVVAPVIGGYIQHWIGWKANFVVLGTVLAIALLTYMLFCPETNQHKNPRACAVEIVYHNYKSLLLHPLFVGCTLISGIAMASNMAYATTSAFILQTQFHLNPIVYGWLTTTVGAGAFLGRFITPIAINRIGGRYTLFSGLMLLLLAGLLLWIFIGLRIVNVPSIIVMVFFTLLAQTMISPNVTSRALSPFKDKRGAAGALFGGFQMLIAFLGSAIIGGFAHDGVLVLAISYTLLGALGIIIFCCVIKE
ncbi:MAG: multidrug effflux MFS transporter [Gammaproteobacteria bacterium]|nr:multidrug effflux MFS transporter [Gammaproteobacteria bacterium]